MLRCDERKSGGIMRTNYFQASATPRALSSALSSIARRSVFTVKSYTIQNREVSSQIKSLAYEVSLYRRRPGPDTEAVDHTFQRVFINNLLFEAPFAQGAVSYCES